MINTQSTILFRMAFASILLPLAALPQAMPPPDMPLPDIRCDGYNLQQMPILTALQKTCIWGQNLVTWTAIFGAGVSAGVSQARHTPAAWTVGAQGYAERYGTAYTQSMAKSTGEFLTSLLTHEDPRDPPPDNPVCGHTHQTAGERVAARIGHALLHAVWVHHENCADGVAWSHVVGAVSSGFVGMAWTPGPENSVAAAWGRTGTAMAGYFGGALFNEFKPQLVSGLSHLFGQHTTSRKGQKR